MPEGPWIFCWWAIVGKWGKRFHRRSLKREPDSAPCVHLWISQMWHVFFKSKKGQSVLSQQTDKHFVSHGWIFWLWTVMQESSATPCQRSFARITQPWKGPPEEFSPVPGVCQEVTVGSVTGVIHLKFCAVSYPLCLHSGTCDITIWPHNSDWN